MRDALERSLVCLILVLRRDRDAVKQIAVAEQGREDRDRSPRPVTSETFVRVATSPLRSDSVVFLRPPVLRSDGFDCASPSMNSCVAS